MTTYRKFRCGLTYRDVYRLLWREDPDPSTWRNKTPRAIIRQLSALKRDAWEEFLRMGGDGVTDAEWVAAKLAAGLVPVRKEIKHMGRSFVVTYWTRPRPPRQPRRPRITP